MLSAGDTLSSLIRRLGLPAGNYSLNTSKEKKEIKLAGQAKFDSCACDLEAIVSLEPNFNFNYSITNCKSIWNENLDYYCATIGLERFKTRMFSIGELEVKRALSPVFGNEKFAVVLIDVYDGPSDTSLNQDEENRNMVKVLERANRLGIPVYEVITKNDYNDDTNKNLAKLRAENWIKIVKTEGDAFAHTFLSESLEKMGVTSIIAMGFNQLHCVRATVETALNSGFAVYTSFDVMQGTIDSRVSEDGTVVEFGFSVAREFYGANTILVDDYTKLPIMNAKK